MILNQSFTIRNRTHAGLRLAEKLMRFKNSSAIVIGVPYGGVLVGYHLAETLGLSFDVIGCKTICHPADPRKSIGSISPDQVVIHDEVYDIPRDYIYRQVVLNQNVLKAQHVFYHSGNSDEVTVENVEVILVGDIIKNADSVLASVRTIRSQRPRKIILAASMVSPDAARLLTCEVDEIVSLLLEEHVEPGKFYEENSILRDEDIRDLVLTSQIDTATADLSFSIT